MAIINQPIRVIDSMPGQSLPMTVINQYSALGIPAFRRAVTFLSENLSSFPRSVRIDGAKLEKKHTLDRLLKRRPNNLQSPTAFWRTLWFHVVSTGNGYARIERDGFFVPSALHNLMPADVLPFRHDRGDGSGLLAYYLHRPTKQVFLAADVIHFQGMSHDGMSGIDPTALHEGVLQQAATLDKFQLKYLLKGTNIHGVVEFPKEAQVTPEQRADIRMVLRRFRGVDTEDDVLILDSGASLKNITTSPQDSQLVEQMRQATKKIAQITGVPPAFLFELSEEKYRSTIEQDGQNLVRFSLRPWIEMAEDELTLKLLSEEEQDQGYTIALNPDALLRGDTAGVNRSAIETANAGLRSRNEARALLGLPRDGDPDSDRLKTLGDTSPSTTADPARSDLPSNQPDDQ